MVEIEGRTLVLSNLGKILYPKAGFTKADLLDHYRRVAPALLPHLEGRPLTLKRYPDGVDEPSFYEKRCPAHRPPWVRTVPVVGKRSGRIDFCEVDDLATLMWVENLAAIELHGSLSRSTSLDRPSFLVFDLDPGAPAGLVDCAEIGLWIRELLGEVGLDSFPKSSGRAGLQIYAPLNGSATYADSKGFARDLARLMEAREPDRVISVMSKARRAGKVFVDWSQNDASKTTVCVYSLRARERPTVSTPVTWQEVREAVRRRSPAPLVFEAQDLPGRLEQHGDLFAKVLTLRQSLPRLPERTARPRPPSA